MGSSSNIGGTKKRIRRCSRRQWADLPPELLGNIITRNVDDPSDVVRARLVCKSWYSSTPNPNLFLSSSLSSSPFPFREESHKFDALETIVLSLYPLAGGGGGDNGGILKLRRKRCGKLSAMHPLEFRERPVSDRVPDVVDLADFKVKVVHRCHLVDNCHEYNVRKVVVCGNTIAAILYDADFYKRSSNLNFFKLGDTKWTKIHSGKFQDMIAFKDKFYAVHLHGMLVSIDPSSLQVSSVVGRPLSPPRSRSTLTKSYRKLLVQSSGSLFMVIQLGYVHTLRVYKLEEGQGRWRPVTNLGDRIFFVSDPECLFSISANDFPPGVCEKWNCVYLKGLQMDNDGGVNNKVEVHRGLSTQYQHLYCFEHRSYQSSLAACPHFMNIFWSLKPRIKHT